MRKREIKIIVPFRFVPARCVIENSKKIAKKFKKLKNTIMNSFQAKIGCKKMRKREIKIIVLFRSVPTRYVIENSKQIAKKFKKLKNTVMASFQVKIGWKRLRKRENKNYRFVSFRSYPKRNRKFHKNCKKFKK